MNNQDQPWQWLIILAVFMVISVLSLGIAISESSRPEKLDQKQEKICKCLEEKCSEENK